MQQSTWFTPEGLEDLLPEEAQKLEFYRRKLVDGFHLSGYSLVLPPIAEFTDSLLTGTARHMAVDTCRFTDQESGKMMGVRADMTPQVARIVSNRLKASDRISRLCYVGEVLKTRNNKAKGSRSPIQVGAEIFGHKGVQSDIEIVELMLDSMKNLNLDVKLSLGHVGIVDELMSKAGLTSQQSSLLIDILERKAIPEYEVFVSGLNLDSALQDVFTVLPHLCGDAKSVIEKAKTLISPLSETCSSDVNQLEDMIKHLSELYPVHIHLDLSDIRGYQYHTGLIFAVYSTCGYLLPIAKGGRYDNIGSDFGLAIPATGFSLDLRATLDLLPNVTNSNAQTVYAPAKTSKALQDKVEQLKSKRIQVIKVYSDQEIPAGSQRLIEDSGHWKLV
ncbi:ATP phosphoribosyltransferase regulatory subunit [Thiomicrorhabdus indica]|uniref:ATP phosphoribosyltransferase regulatory subunit n=1 Tax=Thiomicrorhabdus indica TaxID=2267253 RepID=UPI00102E092B|nr:ATP phosphoribosyltransferase regulatory subunit [Thiomicrorhabdus indica]